MKIWTTVMGQRLDDADNTRSMLLSKYLLDRGHQVTMWTSAWDHIRKEWRQEWKASSSGSTARSDGLEIRFMKGCGYTRNISPMRLIDHWMAAADFTRQARVLARQGARPDLIVASLPDHVTAAAAVAFGREIGAAVIVDVRDKWPDILFDLTRGSPLKQMAGRAAMLVENARTKRALAGADCLVAMMDSMLEWGLAKAGRPQGPRDKVFYLTTSPKNFDVAREPLGPEHPISRALGASAGKTIFAFTGTFNRSQHPDLLLDAISLLNKDGRLQGRDAAFIIGGAGLDAEEVERRAKSLPDTHFVGWMKPHEMNALLGGADVGLLLMRASSEAFNNKTFSYLASGLPIISCATGDLHTMIERDGIGLNIKGGDPAALASAILEILDDPARLARMTGNVRTLFDSAFDQHSNYTAYADHVLDVANFHTAGVPR